MKASSKEQFGYMDYVFTPRISEVDTWTDLMKELTYLQLSGKLTSGCFEYVTTSKNPDFRKTIPEDVTKFWYRENFQVALYYPNKIDIYIGHRGTERSIYNKRREFLGSGGIFGIVISNL
jgi:hypothetical protein